MHIPRCDAKISSPLSQVSIQSWSAPNSNCTASAESIGCSRLHPPRRETAREVLSCENRAPASHRPAQPCARVTQRAALGKCGARNGLAVWAQRRPRMKSRQQYLPRWGSQQQQHDRKIRHGRAPGAANMCCTSRSFTENTATIRPGNLGQPLPTAETGPARECGPRAMPWK